MELFLSLGVSLVLTLVLELAFALVWRVERTDLPTTALANLLTNPVVVLCRHAVSWYWPKYVLAATLALELWAVGTEGFIYCRRSRISHPWAFSLCANGLSYLTGLLLF